MEHCVEPRIVEDRDDDGVGLTPTLRDSDNHHDVMRFALWQLHVLGVRRRIEVHL